ncbi:MAG: winged helix-turn-helix domain-containing protein [Marinicella sp.]
MIIIKHQKDLKHIRRRSLSAQGLLQAQPFGRGLCGVKKAINHIGYVQLDTISVVERAHHHVLYNRVPNFKPEMTDELLNKGDVFEYWSHAAAFLPIKDFRFSLPYKQAIKSGQIHWFKNPDKKLMQELLARIRAEGPLCSRDVEAKQQKKAAGWWDWKPAKKALEQLYMQGDLMVCDRAGFQKTYDLTERVLPQATDVRTPSTEEFAAHLLDQQLRCHGLVSLKGLTYLRRNTELRKTMKTLVNQQLAEHLLDQIQLPNGEFYFMASGTFDQPMPRANNNLAILSPFDNSVIQRDRLKSLFQFEYQIECYVPAAKRKYGYFSLPLMYRDGFIGRMDCKAHRKDQHLEIKSLHFDTTDFDQDAFNSAFIKAIKKFRDFQSCQSISFHKIEPKSLAGKLSKELC